MLLPGATAWWCCAFACLCLPIYAPMPACLSVCLSVRPSVRPSVCLPACLSVRLSVHLSSCLLMKHLHTINVGVACRHANAAATSHCCRFKVAIADLVPGEETDMWVALESSDHKKHSRNHSEFHEDLDARKKQTDSHFKEHQQRHHTRDDPDRVSEPNMDRPVQSSPFVSTSGQQQEHQSSGHYEHSHRDAFKPLHARKSRYAADSSPLHTPADTSLQGGCQHTHLHWLCCIISLDSLCNLCPFLLSLKKGLNHRDLAPASPLLPPPAPFTPSCFVQLFPPAIACQPPFAIVFSFLPLLQSP